MATDWGNFGLPPVQKQGYAYEVDAGLMRTPFETAQPNQKRGNTLNPRQFSAYAFFTQPQLRAAKSAIKVFGFNWFSMELISGYADNTAVPGEFPSIHYVRFTKDYRVTIAGITAAGVTIYRMDMALESKVRPFEWIIDDNVVWNTSATARYVGLRVSPTAFPATINGVRARAGMWDSTISSAYLVINGVRTDLVTAPLPIGESWTMMEISQIQVPQGATVDLAATMSSYAWITDYYKSSAILSGFENNIDNYPPGAFTDNAFGLDISFRRDNV